MQVRWAPPTATRDPTTMPTLDDVDQGIARALDGMDESVDESAVLALLGESEAGQPNDGDESGAAEEDNDGGAALESIMQTTRLLEPPVLIYSAYNNVILDAKDMHGALQIFNRNISSIGLGTLSEYTGTTNLFESMRGETGLQQGYRRRLFCYSGPMTDRLLMVQPWYGSGRGTQGYDHWAKQCLVKFAAWLPPYMYLVSDLAHEAGICGASDGAVLSPFLCTDRRLRMLWMGLELKAAARLRGDGRGNYITRLVAANHPTVKRAHLLIAFVHDELPEGLTEAQFYSSDQSDLFNHLQGAGVGVQIAKYSDIYAAIRNGDLNAKDGKVNLPVDPDHEALDWVTFNTTDYETAASFATAMWDTIDACRADLCHRGTGNGTHELYSQDM